MVLHSSVFKQGKMQYPDGTYAGALNLLLDGKLSLSFFIRNLCIFCTECKALSSILRGGAVNF